MAAQRANLDVRALDAFLTRLDHHRALLFLDEIGKMECASPSFRGLVHHWLDGSSLVVATVAARGRGLIDDVKQREDCFLYTLDRLGADWLVEEIERRIRSALPMA